MAELRTVNPLVAGSSPALGAMMIDPETIELYKESYHLLGKRVRLIYMPNDPSPVQPGTTGTIDYIDDIGTIFVKWDNGRSLGLVPGTDSWEYIND